MQLNRRQFNIFAASAAFAGLAKNAASAIDSGKNGTSGYGPLISDPNGLLDLPQGFSYEVISQFKGEMSDGFQVPDRADGMGCFAIDDDRVSLVRNHELFIDRDKEGPVPGATTLDFTPYDLREDGVPLPGGTTTLIYNLKTGVVEKEFVSLIGTIRNCAGGVTPWGSWLTCEENVSRAGDSIGKDHGWVFEVPATAEKPVDPRPIKAMGRFNHEAVAIDPRTGIIYLTEDRNDSLFYRFIPNAPGKLHEGGKLQALGFAKQPQGGDSRNWDEKTWSVGDWLEAVWIDLENTDSPDDDLRHRGAEKGAVVFARGEGVHWAEDELYFCCTSGGYAQLGQIMRYVPSKHEGTEQENEQPGLLQLFLESDDPNYFNFGDNLTVAPNGHLFVCEDQYTEDAVNSIRGVTNEGQAYEFARLRVKTESAGACFSPDGRVFFVNLYSPTHTLAIRGPWHHLAASS